MNISAYLDLTNNWTCHVAVFPGSLSIFQSSLIGYLTWTLEPISAISSLHSSSFVMIFPAKLKPWLSPTLQVPPPALGSWVTERKTGRDWSHFSSLRLRELLWLPLILTVFPWTTLVPTLPNIYFKPFPSQTFTICPHLSHYHAQMTPSFPLSVRKPKSIGPQFCRLPLTLAHLAHSIYIHATSFSPGAADVWAPKASSSSPGFIPFLSSNQCCHLSNSLLSFPYPQSFFPKPVNMYLWLTSK